MLQESITTAAKPGSNIISNWFTMSPDCYGELAKAQKNVIALQRRIQNLLNYLSLKIQRSS